jgi:hypothetical protein
MLDREHLVEHQGRTEAVMGARQKSSKGQQPEALDTFAAASRSGSVKPKSQGLTAKPATAPKAKSLSKKNAAAAEVLKAGAQGRPGTSAAAKKVSDR